MAKETMREKGFLPIGRSVKTALFGLLCTAALLFPAAVALTYTAAAEEVIEWTVTAIVCACIFFAGFFCAKGSGKNGLLCGGICGLVYVGMLFLLGALVYGEFAFDVQSVLTMLLCLGCGAIGGIVGVNSRQKRKKRRRT